MAILAYQEQGLFLVLVCLLTVPLAVFPIRYVGKKLVSRAIQLQAQAGTITDRFTENLAGVKEVRAFGLERYEIDRFDERIGAPGQCWRVATSQGLHNETYLLTVEDMLFTLPVASAPESRRCVPGACCR